MAGRRSLAYELRESGGLSSGRLGLEILFLLPDDFVQFYTALFHMALDEGVGNQGKGSSGDGTGKESNEDLRIAKGRTGTVLGSDNRLQAQGSGKKYRNTGMTIKSEKALEVKRLVDRGLRTLVEDGLRSLKHRQVSMKQGVSPRSKGSIGPNRPTGSSSTDGNDSGLASLPTLPGTCNNPHCRSFMKESWKFCPRCGTAR